MSSCKIENLSQIANAILPGPEGTRFACVVRDQLQFPPLFFRKKSITSQYSMYGRSLLNCLKSLIEIVCYIFY